MSALEDHQDSQHDDKVPVTTVEKLDQSEIKEIKKPEEIPETTETEAVVAVPVNEKELTSTDDTPLRDYSKKHEKTEIMKKASDLHCPFVWQADLHINTYGDHDIDMLADADIMFEETGFKFRRFIVNLVLCYHSFYKRLIQDSLKYLEELETMLAFSSKKENRDYLFHRINDALFHATHSCRIYILEITNQKSQAKTILNKIKSYDSMDEQNKAGIWAIRANVYVEYGYEGLEAAVTYMNHAISLDPDNPYWHFMKGMYLGRLRRIMNRLAIPSEEEFLALKRAMEMREDPSFFAFTAEVYQETAKRSKRLYETKFVGDDKKSSDQLSLKLDVFNKTAAHLYKKSINLKPTCAHLLFRCGKGFMNLPKPYQDLKLAYSFIEKGLTISPKSSYGNHAMAMYLEKQENNPEQAKRFLNVSVNRKNFQAHFDIVRIKFHESLDVNDLILDLEEMLNMYTEIPKRRKILAEIICYYLFLNHDLGEACVHMRKLIMINSKMCDIINNYKSGVISVHRSFPLLDVILSAIKCEGKNRNQSSEESNLYRKFIEFLCEENIVVRPVPEDLLKKFETVIRNSFEKMQLEAENSHADKTIHRVEDEQTSEYLKYYREQSPQRRNETVDEFFAMFKKNKAVENNSEDDGKNHRKHKHDKHHRSRKSQKSKHDRDASDDRRHKHKSKKNKKKRSRKYSTSTGSESESDSIDRKYTSRHESKVIGCDDTEKISRKMPNSKSYSPESISSKNSKLRSEVVSETKYADPAKSSSELVEENVSGCKLEKQLTVENGNEKIEKLDDLSKNVQNLTIASGSDKEKLVDRIDEKLEKYRKNYSDGRISEEFEDDKKYSKKKHETSHHRHRSHHRDGKHHSSLKHKSKREKRSSSAASSSSNHSYSSKKDKKYEHRKREQYDRKKNLENNEKQLIVENGNEKIEKLDDLSKNVQDLTIASGSDEEKLVDRIDEKLEKYRKNNSDGCISEEFEDDEKHSKKKHEKSHHRHRSHHRDVKDHSSPKRKSKREKRSSSAASSSSNHSYSSKKGNKYGHRKREQYNRKKNVENNTSDDLSGSSKWSRKSHG